MKQNKLTAKTHTNSDSFLGRLNERKNNSTTAKNIYISNDTANHASRCRDTKEEGRMGEFSIQ